MYIINVLLFMLLSVEQATCMENLQSLLNHKKELYIKGNVYIYMYNYMYIHTHLCTSDMQGMDRGYLYFHFYQALSGSKGKWWHIFMYQLTSNIISIII